MGVVVGRGGGCSKKGKVKRSTKALMDEHNFAAGRQVSCLGVCGGLGGGVVGVVGWGGGGVFTDASLRSKKGKVKRSTKALMDEHNFAAGRHVSCCGWVGGGVVGWGCLWGWGCGERGGGVCAPRRAR